MRANRVRRLPRVTLLWWCAAAWAATAAQTFPERVIDRGPHHRVVETTSMITDTSGKTRVLKGRYTELRNGMHFLEAGQWVESAETIEAYPGGAAALRGPHKVIFAANLNQADSAPVDALMPDQGRLSIRPIGLRWRDTRSGRESWIASVRDCEGFILPPNQVLYPNAFDGLDATVRMTYTSGALESDVILHERPELPPGFDVATTGLEVVTVFTSSVAPKVTWHGSSKQIERAEVVGARAAGSGDGDSLVDFGAMQLTLGKAFALHEGRVADASSASSALVMKGWQQQDGVGLLTERVPYETVRKILARLPARQAGRTSPEASRGARAARAPNGAMSVAAVRGPADGLVIDALLVYSAPGWIFRTSQTYLVSAPVTISGPTVFQAGAVVKVTLNGSLMISGPSASVTCPGSTVRRAIITHVQDTGYGEYIEPGPIAQRYPVGLTLYALPSAASLSRLQFCHAQKGVQVYLAPYAASFQKCIWEACDMAINSWWTDVSVNDALKHAVTTMFMASGGQPAFYQQGVIEAADGVRPGPPPEISVQPTDRAAQLGGNTTFLVQASGFGLTYQWYFGHASIPNATARWYTRRNLKHSDAGQYYVVVANDFGSVKSAPAVLWVDGPLTIVQQPQSQTVPAGASVSFFVEAIGNYAPFEYYWFKDGVQIPGEHRHRYTIHNVQPYHQGTYWAVVQRDGSVSSATATLTVSGSPPNNFVYDSDAGFGKGFLINLNYTDAAGQLRINANPAPFPYLNVPCSGRDTLVRLISGSGEIVGEYPTAPLRADNPDLGPYSSPSRTAVDRFGNVWVANREDNRTCDGVERGSLVRIGVVVGGVRGDRVGTPPNHYFDPNPEGQYLAPLSSIIPVGTETRTA